MTASAVQSAAPERSTSSENHDDARPRILCLHGGGVTGAIFKAQCRALIRNLPGFRLVFADGPFLSEAGPGIAAVYGNQGPFRSWLIWQPGQASLNDETIIQLIHQSLDRCKSEDTGSGPWVGLLGFSQGAKVAASLLYDQQIRQEKNMERRGTGYRFGVLMAGRAPLVSLCKQSRSPALSCPSHNSAASFQVTSPSPHILRIPTLHVHGLQDEGLHLHRQLAANYCDRNTSTIIEWDGAHRLPFKSTDVLPITQEIYRIAKDNDVGC